jgi:oligoribonuclease (3'-5' exoribonuclease)
MKIGAFLLYRHFDRSVTKELLRRRNLFHVYNLPEKRKSIKRNYP